MSQSACWSMCWLLWAAVCLWLNCHGAQAVLLGCEAGAELLLVLVLISPSCPSFAFGTVA